MKTHSLITRSFLGKYTVNNESLANTILALTTINGIKQYKLFKKAYVEYLLHRDIYDWADSQELLKAKVISFTIEDDSAINCFGHILKFKEWFNLESLEVCLANPYFNYPEETIEDLIDGIGQLQAWNNIPEVLVMPYENLKSSWRIITQVLFAMNWEVYRNDIQLFFQYWLDPLIKYAPSSAMSINIFNRVLDKDN